MRETRNFMLVVKSQNTNVLMSIHIRNACDLQYTGCIQLKVEAPKEKIHNKQAI
jgi:hypothetical protein